MCKGHETACSGSTPSPSTSMNLLLWVTWQRYIGEAITKKHVTCDLINQDAWGDDATVLREKLLQFLLGHSLGKATNVQVSIPDWGRAWTGIRHLGEGERCKMLRRRSSLEWRLKKQLRWQPLDSCIGIVTGDEPEETCQQDLKQMHR